MSCVKPGVVINLYRDLQLHRVTDAGLSAVLKMLDEDVVAHEVDPDRGLSESESYFDVSWPGEITPTPLEVHFGADRHELGFILNRARGTIREFRGGVEFFVPADFFARLAGLPSTTPTPYPSPAPSPTVVVPANLTFPVAGPDLAWDGPDQRIHGESADIDAGPVRYLDLVCGLVGRPPAGVPLHLYQTEGRGFFEFRGVVQSDATWRSTGYYHGEWRIRQGDDAFTIYLSADSAPDIAFKYEWRGPIGCA
jgi:hypothetical protein